MNAEDKEKAEIIIEAADKVLDSLPATMVEMQATLTRIEEKLETNRLLFGRVKIWLVGNDTDEDE